MIAPATESPTIALGLAISRDDSRCEFAVESALAQGKSVQEIIISDNNPTRSGESVRRWMRDSRVKYINSGVNIGGFANLERAWSSTQLRYFSILGDDDFLHPSFGSSIARAIKASDNAYVAWCGLPTVHQAGEGSRITGKRFSSIDAMREAERLRQVQRYGQWNYLYYSTYDRRAITLDTYRLLSKWPAMVYGQDWAWTYGVALLGKMKLIGEQLYFYCQDNWSRHSGWRQRGIDGFGAFVKPSCEPLELPVVLAANTGMFVALYCLHVSTTPRYQMRGHSTAEASELSQAIIQVAFESAWNLSRHSNRALSSRIKRALANDNGPGLIASMAAILDDALLTRYSITGFVDCLLSLCKESPLVPALAFCPSSQPRPNYVQRIQRRAHQHLRQMIDPPGCRAIFVPRD